VRIERCASMQDAGHAAENSLQEGRKLRVFEREVLHEDSQRVYRSQLYAKVGRASDKNVAECLVQGWPHFHRHTCNPRRDDSHAPSKKNLICRKALQGMRTTQEIHKTASTWSHS
jgi:hypothetical protein